MSTRIFKEDLTFNVETKKIKKWLPVSGLTFTPTLRLWSTSRSIWSSTPATSTWQWWVRPEKDYVLTKISEIFAAVIFKVIEAARKRPMGQKLGIRVSKQQFRCSFLPQFKSLFLNICKCKQLLFGTLHNSYFHKNLVFRGMSSSSIGQTKKKEKKTMG